MSKDFEWKTDEEIRWDEPRSESPADLRTLLKRRWRWLAFSAVLLLIVVGVVYTVLNRRVQQAEDEAAAEVLNAHALVRQAALDRDFDLLNAVSSDQDGWSDLQVNLLNVGLFLERRPLNLKINLEDTTAQEPPTVTLSPDLQTAELIEQIPYQLTDGEQNSQTIWLEHTFHYRRQEESWLLTPLPDNADFWGDWQNSEEGDYVIIIYPQREEALVPFLLEKFDALIGRICQDETVECPFDFKLEIRLDRSPTSLERLNLSVLNTAPIANSGRYHFSFPAPTLIGRPIDEAGRDALYQGYANWLAAVMAFRYAEGATFGSDVAVGEKLAAWGLEPPPQPQLAMPLPQPLPPPPIPFPEQDILLACAGFDVAELTLLRYDPRANRWSDELSGRETTYLSSQVRPFFDSLMAPLPDDSGVLVNITNFDGEEFISRIVFWQAGQERLLLERDYTLQQLPEPLQRQLDPSGRKLVIFDLNFVQTEEGEETRVVPYVLDLAACLSGSCETQLYNGLPYWSPDLSWTLITALENQSQLTLQDERTGEEVSIGNGSSPFWLDNESFIYIRQVEDAEAGTGAIETVEIVAAAVDDPLNGRVLVDSAAISTAITGNDPTVPVGIHYVVAHPDQPDWLFMSATLSPFAEPQTHYILSFRGDTGELSIVLNLENFQDYSFYITANGQLMAVQTSNDLMLFPLDSAEKTAGTPNEAYTLDGTYSHDWSQDGRWLLIVGQVSFRLIAPGYNYDQTIIHDNSACTTAAWVNPPG